jgi:hypothetical protein
MEPDLNQTKMPVSRLLMEAATHFPGRDLLAIVHSHLEGLGLQNRLRYVRTVVGYRWPRQEHLAAAPATLEVDRVDRVAHPAGRLTHC